MFIHCLSLDIREPMTQAYINVKKGDTARKLIFTFSNYGSAYHISDGCTAVFRAKKPDGTILFNSCTINGNAVEYIFTSQTVAAVGIVECEVTLADADGKQITSPRFALIVENVLYSDDEVESTNEFTKLQEALAKVSGLGSASIAMRVDGGFIQYSTDDGKTWVNLIAESDLKGDKGDKGDKGADGKDGAPGKDGTDGKDGTNGITPHIGENGNWYIGNTDTGKPSRGEQGVKGDKGDKGADGAPGAKGDKGDAFTYSDFTAEQLAALKGEKGDTGPQGPTGATGAQGPAGANGKSAYQYAQEGGYTGTEEALAEKLAQEPLIGTTNELTPTQVREAVSVGIPVKVQYTHSTYGIISFTAFTISESLNMLASNIIIYYNGVYILVELVGYVQSGEWGFMTTTLAQKTDIPAALPNPNAITFTGAVTGSYDGSTAKTVNIPSAVTDGHINSLIDAKLGVIENGAY